VGLLDSGHDAAVDLVLGQAGGVGVIEERMLEPGVGGDPAEEALGAPHLVSEALDLVLLLEELEGDDWLDHSS
jgi:hypothetical protein